MPANRNVTASPERPDGEELRSADRRRTGVACPNRASPGKGLGTAFGPREGLIGEGLIRDLSRANGTASVDETKAVYQPAPPWNRG